MTPLSLLKGKKMLVNTDMDVKVILEIQEVTEQHYSRDLEPATPENDWWPAQETWKKFRVKFTNGKYKEYDSLSQIELVE